MKSGRKELCTFKRSQNRLQDELVEKQLKRIAARAMGATLVARGWSALKPHVEVSGDAGNYLYAAKQIFKREGVREFTEDSFEAHWDGIQRRYYTSGRSHGWRSDSNHVPQTADGSPSPQGGTTAFQFAGAGAIKLPGDSKPYFTDIYDQDDNIEHIISSIQTAKDTDMNLRNHVLCYGPPGCGKTETQKAALTMLGRDGAHAFDATDTTKAGIVNLLLDMQVIPPILAFEELEKCHEDNFSCLLGIMDDRGYISKTNARIGSVTRQAPCLVMATVNDLEKFMSFHDGALFDRFTEPLYFAMPDRQLLKKILLREVKKIPGGKEAWIEPALDFAMSVEKTYKARRVKAIMSNGRDKLLTGEYQKQMERMIARRILDVEKLKMFNVKA